MLTVTYVHDLWEGIGRSAENPRRAHSGTGVNRLHVIGLAVAVNQKQGFHVRLLDHVLEFGGAVAGVYRYKNRADAGRGIEDGQPVRDIGRPDADMIPLADSQREHSLRHAIYPGI